MKNLVSILYIKIFNPKFLYINSYFKKNSLKRKIKIILKSKFQVFFYDFYNNNYQFKIDNNFRNLFIGANKKEKFENYIVNILLKNMPIEFLEGNKFFSKEIKKINSLMSNKTFISSQSLTFNTQFKYYLLHNYKNNMLIYLQHGHGYGMDQSNLSEI